MFESVKQMSDAVKPAATLLSDRVSVTNAGAVTGDLVDKLAWTAVFGADSAAAHTMLKAREVLLEYAQFVQTFRMFCQVRRLGTREVEREASLWQARIFNPRIPNNAMVLGFRPDWKSASADPTPQGS